MKEIQVIADGHKFLGKIIPTTGARTHLIQRGSHLNLILWLVFLLGNLEGDAGIFSHHA